jgi:hypothetical protein
MRTNIRLLLCVVVAALGTGLQATDPPAAKPSGRVLVLDNERTLEGDIEQQGTQYRIRRSVGETWVPSEKVLKLCQSREEAYQFLRSRANLTDADERLRLAQWCQVQGLKEQAFAEVKAAVELRPNHAESKRLLRTLERALATATSASENSAKKDAGKEQVSAPPIDLNTESLSFYVTKVQPVVMNACASCHASGKINSFQLSRAFEGGLANRKTLQRNLTSILAQVNIEKPELSPFLLKAVSIHGDMAQPALKGKQAQAYKILEDWVQLTVANNPHLREKNSGPNLPLNLTETKADEASTPKKEDKPAAGPGDPFDPAIFNRQVHPEKPNPTPKTNEPGSKSP